MFWLRQVSCWPPPQSDPPKTGLVFILVCPDLAKISGFGQPHVSTRNVGFMDSPDQFQMALRSKTMLWCLPNARMWVISKKKKKKSMCDNEWLLYRRWCFEGLQLGIWFHAIRAGQSAQRYTHYEKWFWVILNDKRNLSVVNVPVEHSLASCYLLALSFVSLVSLFVLIGQL